MITQIDILETDDQLKSMPTIYDDTHTAKYSSISVISKEDTKNDGYMHLLSTYNNLIVVASTEEYKTVFTNSPVKRPIVSAIKNHVNMMFLRKFGILTITTIYMRA